MIMPLDRRLIEVVADTCIDRQIRSGLPIVLKIAGVVPLNIVDIEKVAEAGRPHLIGQKVGHTRTSKILAGLGGIKTGERITAMRLDGGGSGHPDMLESDTHLQR